MKINIRDLFSELDPEEYENIDIKNNSDNNPDFDKIKQDVLNNINRNNIAASSNSERRDRKFRRPFRNIWAAALIICVTATTVFAFNNVEYFKRIFGNDVEITEKNIQNVLATTENKNLIFSVESLLSDGNQNYFVISLETKNNEKIGKLLPTTIKLHSDKLQGLSLASLTEIENSNTSARKTYYLYKLNTNSNLIGENVKMSFSRNADENMTVSFRIEDNNNLKELKTEDFQILDDKYVVTEIKYSNLGMNIKGRPLEDTDIIPTIEIKLKYKDGSIKEVSAKPEDSDKFGFIYHRDKQYFMNTVTFKELIDFDLIESVILEGKEIKID